MTNFKDFYNRLKCSDAYQKLNQNPIAYFCMEYALPKNLPTYAGGLGVLAGDYVMEARQQNIPMVAIGLFYSKKCKIDNKGNMYVDNDPEKLGLKPVVDKFGKTIKIMIPIADRPIYIQAWLYDDGTIPVYLLDTNISDNEQTDRSITDLLYVFDSERRLKQEIILGIGGVRMLCALGIEPSIFHMNEGHSTLLIYELASLIMKKESTSFSDAFNQARQKIAFTNHTLVVGARDSFGYDLASRVLTAYSDEIGVPVEELIYKGLDNYKTSMAATNLAFRASTKINAVSKLHAEEAAKVWPDHPMIPITNGVNVLRWDKIKDDEIAQKHKENKRKLLDLIRKQSGEKWDENVLLVGWARRITGYKRPVSFFDNIESTKQLLQNKEMPIKLVFGGYPHYLDEEGHWLLGKLRDLSRQELKGSVVFLENYNTDISEIMTAGSDVWLNTPIVGLEACGTSGMKAALNGTVLCSTDDGWLPEVNLEEIGFKLENDLSWNLIDVFGNKIAPLYYNSLRENTPYWTQKMTFCREAILQNFGTDRMFKDYLEQIYEPILAEQK